MQKVRPHSHASQTDKNEHKAWPLLMVWLGGRYLQRALRMEESSDKPLVAVITRLVPQKVHRCRPLANCLFFWIAFEAHFKPMLPQGIHLIRHSVWRTADLGGQFVLLGSGHADGDFRGMAEHDFKGHPNVRLMIMYSDSLAHLIYAAADIILVPSLFEPCGEWSLSFGHMPLSLHVCMPAHKLMPCACRPDTAGGHAVRSHSGGEADRRPGRHSQGCRRRCALLL